jgi:hypothetical protein
MTLSEDFEIHSIKRPLLLAVIDVFVALMPNQLL